ncbi:MAG: hypothetical protein N2746_05560 [Deltaproteobacteria bacterium]|nr:hypothetical protein [Deltaproteobacteria bacterium]
MLPFRKILLLTLGLLLFILIAVFNPESRAKRLVDRGLREAKSNNLHLAGKIFQRAAQICPECYLARFNLGNVFLATTYYHEALNEFYAAASIKPKDPLSLYEIARVHAILDHKETALFYLEQSILNGFSDIRRLNSDPDLSGLHSDERFKRLIKIWESINAEKAHQ